jgi:tripartite ATP-independent transporter DctM subunit
MDTSFVPALTMCGLLVLLLVVGVPIAFIVTFLGILACFVWVGSTSVVQVVQSYYGTGTSDILLCLPLFLLMAEIIVVAKIGEDLFNAIRVWTGRLRGGVSAATIVGCGFFGAICGSSTATIAAVGSFALSEMLKLGYKKSFAAGTVCIGGTLGVMIPPSIIMIIYGALADESIGKLFIAGVVPGILMIIGYGGLSVLIGILNPSAAPVANKKCSFREKIRASRAVFPFVAIFIAMFYAFYTGIATPTEVAAVGVLVSIVAAVAMNRIEIRGLYEATKKTGVTTAFVLFIIAGAKFFTFAISATGVSGLITGAITALNLSPLLLVLMMMALYIVMGCFIDSAGMLTLTIPFFLPTLLAAKVDLIWFGILATINAELGYCTPPFGFNLFVLKGVAPAEVSMGDIIVGMMPFLGVTFLVLIAVIVFPSLAVWLPSHM